MVMTLPHGSIMEWDRGGTLCVPTEGDRSPVSVDFNRMEETDRMNNGLLRGYFIADKRTWSCSWESIPAPTDKTIDEKAGGSEIEDFYLATKGDFLLTIKHVDSGLNETVRVRFASFNKEHVARGAYDIWDISVSLEEC